MMAPKCSRRSNMRARTWLSAGFLVALLAACCGTALAESDGTTPLLWAVHNNDIDAVDRLIKAGADINVKNEYGVTPLSEAAVNGNTAIIEKLLKAGANADSPSADGMTALMIVARGTNIKAAKLLLDHGANVNAAEQQKKQTALMWAAAQSQAAMIKELIAHGAD